MWHFLGMNLSDLSKVLLCSDVIFKIATICVNVFIEYFQSKQRQICVAIVEKCLQGSKCRAKILLK